MKYRRLSREILGIIAVSALPALVFGLTTSHVTLALVEDYCFFHDIPMTEFDWIAADRTIMALSVLFSVCIFGAVFLALLNRRLAYIRTITAGIRALRSGSGQPPLPLEGRNELTELAGAINEMSEAQERLRRKEQALALEKEQLIRSLSHDIRTPLTAILAYSEYLATREQLSPEAQKEYLELIRRKAGQIRDLTAVLLEGGKRSPEPFADGRLLLEQLAAEFAGELEEEFDIRVDFSRCGAFSGSFDVHELQRIFDNLCSNVRKYADPAQPVFLSVSLEEGSLVIEQRNAVRSPGSSPESYQIGLNSIRRIAQHYSGGVSVRQTAQEFSIRINLSLK